jgi:CarD family transcriptional regulator
VAIVEQIESRQILGVAQDFYLLRLQANNSVVMVPVQNVGSIGLRRLIQQQECRDLMEQLGQMIERPSARDWKDRFRGIDSLQCAVETSSPLPRF